jgi:hypothetical protein
MGNGGCRLLGDRASVESPLKNASSARVTLQQHSGATSPSMTPPQEAAQKCALELVLRRQQGFTNLFGPVSASARPLGSPGQARKFYTQVQSEDFTETLFFY